MKKLLPIILLFSFTKLNAQNVGIGTNKPLSKLHVAGDLRVDSLGKQDSGVVIHNKSGVLKSLQFTGKKSDVLRGDGTFQSLNAVAADALYWSTTGNSGTEPDSNFIGTTDKNPLKFRVNNSSAGEINPLNNNTTLGLFAGFQLGSSQGNTAFGANALEIHYKGNNNTAIGWGSLPNDTVGSANTAVGAGSLGSNESGNRNCAFGVSALVGNTTGYENCAIGYLSITGSGRLGSAPPGGYQNTAVGTRSMQQNDFGNKNTAVGADALASNWAGGQNTAIGTQSLHYNRESNQTAVGYQSLYSNINGQNNTSVGYQALYGNTSGSSNVGVGFMSLLVNSTGVSNTATGTRALVSNTTGVNNTGYGYGALLSNVTGFQNTALGMLADVTAGNLQNATAIGYRAKVNASNKVRIGNAAVTRIEGQVPFSTPSDGRYKFNVKEDVIGLKFIMQLRPVTYQFDVSSFDQTNTGNIIQASYNKAAAIRRTGFIAQEVEKAAQQSHYDFSGINKPQSEQDHYSLSYEAFVVPLVKGMQEQQLIIEKMQNLNQQLMQKINDLQAEIDIIKSTMQQR
ncbi:MAG: tail fiber domain-containing protein [Chitinophagaceae bacterium]|nr:tail fiber domain-containing protein [Chitinophagaceae bacterium]